MLIGWLLGSGWITTYLFFLPILAQLKQVEYSFWNVSFIHVYKEINVVADLMSNEVLSLNFNTTWVLHTRLQRGYWYVILAMESQSNINSFERRRLWSWRCFKGAVVDKLLLDEFLKPTIECKNKITVSTFSFSKNKNKSM